MILAAEKQDVLVIGDDTARKATISTNQMSKLEYLLTKGLYKDPITAVIAEWTNNGIDSVVQAGKNPIENPVIVNLGKNEQGQFALTVEDKGLGLDDNDFQNVCMSYLTSTKENDNDTIGHFGIGMKSFLSLERGATFTCRKDGVERKYYCYEGAEFLDYDLLYEKPTTEENGVKCELIIPDYSEFRLFEDKAKSKLCYYDTAVIIVNGQPFDNKIYRNDLFQFSSLRRTEMHIALKDVYYPIDWEALGIKAIPVPVALRFSLSDGFIPTPSRESYITNKHTKEVIMNKIRDVAAWFVTTYNQQFTEPKMLCDILDKINQYKHFVTLAGSSLEIDSLTAYTSIQLEEPKVLGADRFTSKEWKNLYSNLFEEFEISAHYEHSAWKNKRIYTNIPTFCRNSLKILYCAETPIGNVKSYLIEKYGNNEFLAVVKAHKRPLRLGADINRKVEPYEGLLFLKTRKRNEWRPLIQEFEAVKDLHIAKFVDCRNIEKSKEYIDWLDVKKETQKETRRLNKEAGIYKGLNKQADEITMAYAREPKAGRTWVFEKDTYKVVDLPKNKYLTVLVKEEEKAEALKYVGYGKFKNIRFALVGVKDSKSIPQTHQFITLNQFIMNSKGFKRLATTLLYRKLVEEFDTIYSANDGLFKNVLKDQLKDRKILKEYIDTYSKHIQTDLAQGILEVAIEHNLFDLTHDDVYKRLKNDIKKYEFVTCLSQPLSWNTIDVQKYKRVLNQMLIMRSNKYNDIPEELVQKAA